VHHRPSRLTQACQQIAHAICQRLAAHRPPLLVALDGGSGSGKSTLAAMLVQRLDATWVPLDDFFSAHIPESQWETMSVPQKLLKVFDWPRVRAQALEPLLAGQPACWYPFDFSQPRPDGTYPQRAEPETRAPAPVLLLDGAYSASPQLADRVGLSVLVDVPRPIRHARLAAREDPDFLARWHARWDAVEIHYFTTIRPPAAFDLIVTPCN
jgi:para-aminobenzoate synthetase